MISSTACEQLRICAVNNTRLQSMKTAQMTPCCFLNILYYS